MYTEDLKLLTLALDGKLNGRQLTSYLSRNYPFPKATQETIDEIKYMTSLSVEHLKEQVYNEAFSPEVFPLAVNRLLDER
jgi:hypothetical protein